MRGFYHFTKRIIVIGQYRMYRKQRKKIQFFKNDEFPSRKIGS